MDNTRYVIKPSSDVYVLKTDKDDDEEKEKEKEDFMTYVVNLMNGNFGSYYTGDTCGRYIYAIFHAIMTFVALYLTFRCRKYGSTNLFIEIFAALFCPYFYIMWILVSHGTCDIISGETHNNNLI
jgi:hypothetical protein